MRYNFDEIIPRRHTNSYKWDSAPEDDVLPLWVADMDFRTAPAVTEALIRRVKHGIFGYTQVPAEYYETICAWFKRKHGWTIEKEWVIYTSGVVPAVSAIIKALTVPGDKVLIQTPVYNCFFSSIRNNGCEVESNPLVYENHTYHIDFGDLERKASDERVKMMLLCNPHNPAGRVWTKDELAQIGTICLRHGVTVVSDEIHCELTYPGHDYTPFASLPENLTRHAVVCISPSKAFNIAGLQIANIVAPDEEMRGRIGKAINVNEVCDVNPFGVIATIAAYREGEDWLDQLLDYLQGNYRFMKTFCEENLPDFPVCDLEGTYLTWMDCRALAMPSAEIELRLIQETRLWLNAGSIYGQEGEGFMRWNIACPRAILAESLRRFKGFTDCRK